MNRGRLEARSLSKRLGGAEVLRDVSFVVQPGENLAVLGASGAGKSTLLRLLCGFEAPDQGMVLVNGAPASTPGRIILAPHRRGVSLVFQDLALWPNLTVRANVMMGLSGTPLSRSESHQRTQEALRLCGIEEIASRKPAALSGGQQQRVALARAVAVRPAFLLLDEPYAGLDLILKARLLPEVRRLAALHDTTVILVTHDPWEAQSLCESAVVLDSGRVVEAGRLTELLDRPQSELLRQFRKLNHRSEPMSRSASYELAGGMMEEV